MKQVIFKRIIIVTMVLSIASLAFAFIFISPALAIPNESLWGEGVRDYIKSNSGLPTEVVDPRKAAVNIINIALGFLGILAVIIILFAGFKWMTAGGNEENVSAAKKILIAGVIGLVIILSAYALANFVINQLLKATTGTEYN